MRNCSTNYRDFNALKTFISGGEFDLAQQILGLPNGKNDREHNQPCPIPGCPSDDDGFYVRRDNGTFQCRQCHRGWDLIALVAAVKVISQSEAFDIVAAASGYTAQALPINACSPKPRYRTVHVVSPSADSVSVDTLLSQEVSFYPHCQAKMPSGTTTIGQFLDDCKNGTYREQVEGIRAEQDKKKRKELKKELLPAITPHAKPQAQRNNAACDEAGRSGTALVDIDGIPGGELEPTKANIVALPYVYAVGVSASGTGLFALTGYEGMLDLKTLLTAMQADFPYEIDCGSDLCRLRFATFDPNLVIKDTVYPAILTERTEPEGNANGMPLVGAAPSAVTPTTVNAPSYQWEPFPLGALPWTLGDFVKDVSDSIDIDPAHTAISALAVLSGLIGRTFEIELKVGYREFAIQQLKR